MLHRCLHRHYGKRNPFLKDGECGEDGERDTGTGLPGEGAAQALVYSPPGGEKHKIQSTVGGRGIPRPTPHKRLGNPVHKAGSKTNSNCVFPSPNLLLGQFSQLGLWWQRPRILAMIFSLEHCNV